MLQGSLALVDAGWSGDWSRIGAISVEQEALARSIITVAASAHSVTALICVCLAQQGGYSLPLAAFKVGDVHATSVRLHAQMCQ